MGGISTMLKSLALASPIDFLELVLTEQPISLHQDIVDWQSHSTGQRHNNSCKVQPHLCNLLFLCTLPADFLGTAPRVYYCQSVYFTTAFRPIIQWPDNTAESLQQQYHGGLAENVCRWSILNKSLQLQERSECTRRAPFPSAAGRGGGKGVPVHLREGRRSHS